MNRRLKVFSQSDVTCNFVDTTNFKLTTDNKYLKDAMTNYKLNVYSTTIHNVVIFAGMTIAMSAFILTMVYKQPFWVCFFSLMGTMGLAKLLAIKFYKATANFFVSEKGVKIEWIDEFGILKHPNYDFNFDQLSEYVLEPWGDTYRMKIKTQEDKTIKLEFKNTSKQVDNFQSFFEDFQNAINNYNKKDNDITNDIKVGKTFWGGTTAKVVGAFILVAIIFGWTKYLSGEQINANAPKLTIATIAGIIYVGRIIFASLPDKKN
jgi:hypothetical protein